MIVVSMSMLLLFSSCSSSDKSTNLILGENVLYPDNEPATITVISGDKKEVISAVDMLPSKPEISPDTTKMAFISPLEMEVYGEVWLYTAKSGERKLMITREQLGKEESPKQLLWYDDSHLLVINGNAEGTISSNRHLLLYDLENNQLNSLMQVDKNQDIRKMSLQESKVILEVATYNDDFSEDEKVEIIEYEIK